MPVVRGREGTSAEQLAPLHLITASPTDSLLASFIDAACVPLDASHASGSLERAEVIRATHPDLASGSIHAAAVLGDDVAVRRFLALDPAHARAKAGPRDWDALTHLCFSRYLRLDEARSDGFVRAAAALLDAGADPNTGWTEPRHTPEPVSESALYGAAGVAHHAGLTRLLLDRGANPNDEETPYHAPETRDNAALKVLVASGKLSEKSLATMLIRKTDWHDYDGVRLLLDSGVDPNRMTRWGKTALHSAILRDNELKIVELLLDHGADPTLVTTHPDHSGRPVPGRSAMAMAARRGRGDLLDLFERRDIPVELLGVDRLIAMCARHDRSGVLEAATREPALRGELMADGGRLLAEFAGNGNTDGVRQLLDLGVDARARYELGDGYFDIPPHSLAIHVAAWRARHETVKLLIERGSPMDVPDDNGRTPLALAVRACVASYWTHRRSPESVEALLRAGASVEGVVFPSGYAEVDRLLKRHSTRD